MTENEWQFCDSASCVGTGYRVDRTTWVKAFFRSMLGREGVDRVGGNIGREAAVGICSDVRQRYKALAQSYIRSILGKY